MISFREWLKKKNFNELSNVQPADQTSIIGAIVGAQQQNNPSNVATTLAKKNSPLVAAIMSDPVAEKIKAIADAKKQKSNPQVQSINNQLPPNIGTTMGAV